MLNNFFYIYIYIHIYYYKKTLIYCNAWTRVSLFCIRSSPQRILHALSLFSELQTRSLGREHRHNEAWHLIRTSGSGGESIRKRFFSYAWIARRRGQSRPGRSPEQPDATSINFLDLKSKPGDRVTQRERASRLESDPRKSDPKTKKAWMMPVLILLPSGRRRNQERRIPQRLRVELDLRD